MRSRDAAVASIEARPLSIPFRKSFRHAAAERSAMQSICVTASDRAGRAGLGEGCPREYVTGESIASSLAFVHAHRDEWTRRIGDAGSLRAWIAGNGAAIDANPAAWCAVEVALLDLFGRQASLPIEALLGIAVDDTVFRYTAVLGDAAPAAFEGQLRAYADAGFRTFKVKLSGDAASDAAKVRALRAAGIEPSHVRADANNLWRDADTAIAFLRELAYPFAAIEEPLAVGDIEAMRRISLATGAPIVLDESLTRVDQLGALASCSGAWWINLRVSKMGGVLRSLDLARAASERGVPLVAGAHVGETSVLSRAALSVVCAHRGSVVAQEGAFGTHLLQHDIVPVPLMFGAAGVLDAGSWLRRPGLGLE